MDNYTKGRARQNTSPSTQQTDCCLSAVKTYDNVKSRARREEDSWEATDKNTKGYNQEGTSISNKHTPV